MEKWDQIYARCQRSIINIVDLAGSERLSKEAKDSFGGKAVDHANMNIETGFINKSLFQFSNVIEKLS